MEKNIFSGTPPECVTRPYCGKDGTNHFLLHLHHHYYYEVMELGDPYEFFVDSFLLGHKHHDSTDVIHKNEHDRNLGIIKNLLTKRKDLVEKHFSSPNPLDDYSIVLTDMKSEPESSGCNQTANHSDNSEKEEFLSRKQLPNDKCLDAEVNAPFGCRFSTDVLDILVRGINRAEIFVKQIDTDTLRSLLVGTLDTTLSVKYTRRLSYLFHALKEEGWICRNWQKTIEDGQVIYKRDGVTLMKANDLSPALYSATADKKKFHYQVLIDDMVRRIKKYYIN